MSKEAEAKRFPESDLISSLAMVIEEATKCSMVAQQLATKKVRTRTRPQGETKYRLTVDELELFHEHIEQLACRIREQDDIRRLLDQVQEFQRRAVQLVEPELPPPAADIQACVDLGSQLDIELPEIIELRQRLSHAQWMEAVEEGLDGRRRLTLDGIAQLVETGRTLPPYHVVERAMGELQGLLLSGQQHEERARLALTARPVQSLTEVEALLRDAEKVPASLPNVESLQEVVQKAQDWLERVVALTEKKEHPRLEVVEALVARGQPLPVLLPDLSRLENMANSARAWRERTSRTFLKRNSFTLLEVLSPRADVSVHQSRGKRRRPKEEHLLSSDLETDGSTVAQVVDAYRAAEDRELELVRGLRAGNLQKRQTEAQQGKYCLCRQRLRGYMLQCELCRDYFHASCVPLAQRGSGKGRSGGGSDGTPPPPPPPTPPPADAHFLCPLCQRSRRPRLDTVLSLLVSHQKLAVRLAEGVALQCLTERAMRWQDRARQVLSSEEMVASLSSLAAVSQRAETSAKERAEKTAGRQAAKADQRNSESSLGADAESSDSSRDASSVHIKRESSEQPAAPPAGFSSSEHAYSSAFKQTPPPPTRKPRKAVLSPRRADSPPPPPPPPPPAPARPLPPESVALLETVLMEGDLLEVSLEETEQLWRLLLAARPAAADLNFPDIDIVKMEEGGARRKSAGAGRKKRSPDSPRGLQPPKRLKVKVKPPEDSADPTTPSPGPEQTSPSPSKRTPKAAAAGFKRKLTKTKKMVWDKNQRHPKGGARSSEDGESGPISNYVEDCAATPCQKPHGSCINWIGCDACEQWYHYICVGLPKNYQVTEDMVYMCPRCQNSQAPRGPTESAGSSLLDLAAAAEEQDGASALLSLASGGASPAAALKREPTEPTGTARSIADDEHDDDEQEE
ncbi:lysine-specific demethylase 5A-like [Pollicipes pollicipes]|uniref:lysine-specific demethylase 5A-like n=1 Tax=Pollicipes pollicipes TaxID=41117 RepID=UPI001884BFCD|nr:lysine-specific demethylase 5A-like [Pollicipes pollicipes]